MTLEICCPTVGGHLPAIRSWIRTSSQKLTVTPMEELSGYLPKVQEFYQSIATADILAYFHSDLTIHEKDWDLRVLKEFENPDVAIVSFFGARNLGIHDIYKTPYQLHQLARSDCYSNLDDAEAHGQRFRDEMDVAMIDSFSLIIRKSFLDQIGGWPVHMPPSHGSDMWACMMAARHSKRVRLIGIQCAHTSGGARHFDYPAWAATTKWGSDAEMHRVWHDYLYENFRDVLPVEVK